MARDRAAYFYNNQKAARKAVPLRKALEARRIRHQHNQELSQVERVEESVADLIESSAKHDVARKGGWKKGPSEQLGVVIARRLVDRAKGVGRKARSRLAQSKDS